MYIVYFPVCVKELKIDVLKEFGLGPLKWSPAQNFHEIIILKHRLVLP